MSLFGSLMGDFDDDIFGNHMNAMNMQMRSMNRLMNSFMPDPFNMLAPFDPGFQQNALMERQVGPPAMGGFFGFPTMPNMNRLLTADIGNNGGTSFRSSSVITMSSGPDGRPQIYQSTSSTKTGPGGIRETRRTVEDSVNGVKKMAIGHHIGERAHIIEKEQDLRSGQLEEHQEFINLAEDDAEDFDREFTTKASSGRVGASGLRAIGPAPQPSLTIEPLDDDDDDEVVETTAAVGGRQHQPQQHRPSSSGGGHSSHQRRYMPAPPGQPSPSHPNSSTSATNFVSAAPTSSTLPSTATATAHATSSSLSSTPSLLSTSVYATAPQMPHNSSEAFAAANISNPNSYYAALPSARRSTSAYHHHHHHQHHHHRGNHPNLSGVSARRPLRTAPSSPLATTPTMHNHSTASSPSVHPHPYNTSGARRSHHNHHQHRPKKAAAKQVAATTATTAQQQQQQQQTNATVKTKQHKSSNSNPQEDESNKQKD